MSTNIQLNYLSDSGYQILYPVTLSFITKVTDTVSEYYGLNKNSNLDDVLTKLVELTIGYPITIQILSNSIGISQLNFKIVNNGTTETYTTDSNGYINLVLKEGTYNYTIDKQYDDINSGSGSIVVSSNNRNFTITLNKVGSEIVVTSSKTLKISSASRNLKFFLVGGGGGGGCIVSYNQNGMFNGASGGGGGGCFYTAYTNYSSLNLTCTIGSGGSGAVVNTDGTKGKGSSGGTTILKFNSNTFQATGGNGGTSDTIREYGWFTGGISCSGGTGGTPQAGGAGGNFTYIRKTSGSDTIVYGTGSSGTHKYLDSSQSLCGSGGPCSQKYSTSSEYGRGGSGYTTEFGVASFPYRGQSGNNGVIYIHLGE